MTQPKFTPGPWEAGSNPAGIGSNDWVVRPQGEFPHGEWIADVGYGSTDPERRANGALIAAAPDMYAALEDAEQAMLAWDFGTVTIVPIIRAALAKAGRA